MKILFVTSEAVPFIKTGGLADVAGSLPLEIKRKGEDIRVVLPLYQQISSLYREKMKKIAEYYVDLNWRHQYAGVFELKHEGVTFYFIDNEQYFKRDEIYGAWDDGERFMFFSKAVTILPKVISFQPDIIHSNDWHTGMVNVFLQDFKRGDRFYHSIKGVFTIHNLKYQGIFPSSLLFEVGGLSDIYYREDTLKYYDTINMMKGGIVFSDAFTTVSESYATEIHYPYFGEHLEGVINRYAYKMRGIINGIDYKFWNPEEDAALFSNYSIKTWKHGKKKNKKVLQEKLGLPVGDMPIIAMVSRLVENKGINLVRHIFDELIQENIQFIVLGTGNKEFEDSFKYFAWRYPNKVAARIYYNEEEAHQIYAASDLFLMPSFIEPCGISQMVSMRYGTIPIVRETGGLRDTVQAYNQFTKEGNGFSFSNINAHDMLYTIRQALHYYQGEDFEIIVENAMESVNDWESSAKKYMNLYQSLI